jgi:hypothetical protein
MLIGNLKYQMIYEDQQILQIHQQIINLNFYYQFNLNFNYQINLNFNSIKLHFFIQNFFYNFHL